MPSTVYCLFSPLAKLERERKRDAFDVGNQASSSLSLSLNILIPSLFEIFLSYYLHHNRISV